MSTGFFNSASVIPENARETKCKQKKAALHKNKAAANLPKYAVSAALRQNYIEHCKFKNTLERKFIFSKALIELEKSRYDARFPQTFGKLKKPDNPNKPNGVQKTFCKLFGHYFHKIRLAWLSEKIGNKARRCLAIIVKFPAEKRF